MTNQDWIFRVISSFYDKARNDLLIGYHFRNIPDFNEHIPRIAAFWELQLLGRSEIKISKPFDVINIHSPLNIKRGELGRWLVLFRQTLKEKLSENPEMKTIEEDWEKKLIFFEMTFLRSLGL
jgi:truncated hemoglobin YjbI